MRITEVRVHQLSAKLKERFGWSLNWAQERHATLVEVLTDAGITGWGDGDFGGDKLIANPQLVIGRSPFAVEAIFDELRSPGGKQQRVGSPAAAGLDVALWDIIGKALGEPVWRLLGKQYRDRVQPYCTAMYRKDWPDLATGLAAEAMEWKARGYSLIKMKIGYGPEVDVEVVRAVRNAIGPETGLAVDSNCAYDAGTAARLGKLLEPFALLWWEEPLLANDYTGYARLREAFAIPLAGGETMFTDELIQHYVQPRLVDILQPDIEHVGLTGGRRLTYLTWLNHMRLIPHNWGTAVRTVSELHWAATIPPVSEGLYAPPVMIEFDRTESPFRDAVVAEPVDIGRDGKLPVPDKPGLGITVLPEAVESFRKNLIVIC
ncbi:MAG: mandelate racemase/muconate lactonizing enzyme family protein [Acidobacteria bacterium]|nr:mandelate racemase/muconate lactonizing enzyme family protein [Acidobacteriota bacterium]